MEHMLGPGRGQILLLENIVADEGFGFSSKDEAQMELGKGLSHRVRGD